jgi:hypothetical protein
MYKIFQYYSRYQNARGGFARLPGWARFIVAVFALPGVALVALSLLALLVSIAALSLLTIPVYRVLSAMTGSGEPDAQPSVAQGDEQFVEPVSVEAQEAPEPVPGTRRQIEVKIVEG